MSSSLNKIILHSGRAYPFWKGEPLVFSGAIQCVEGSPALGELVQVLDHQKKLIGVGAFNPYSSYRVRLLIYDNEQIPFDWQSILHFRLQKAIEKRQRLNLPNEQTNVYRLFNSEGDGLSGLTIDIFDSHAVVSSTACWVELRKNFIKSSLEKIAHIKHIIWRSQKKALQQDGMEIIEETHHDATFPLIRVKENNIHYYVDLHHGQKTGFYCDQRDNRALVRQFSKGKTVIDCFCYSGGFSLNASLGGAKSVVGIDSSIHAISLANKNVSLNSLSNIRFICDKVDHYLKTAEQADLIILDPPKLAPTRHSLSRAKKRYLELNQLALTRLSEQGFLLTCSCSNAITKDDLINIVKTAAKNLDKKIKILKISGVGEDHPIVSGAQYGAYLKAIFIQCCGTRKHS